MNDKLDKIPQSIESEMCALASLMLAGDNRAMQSKVFSLLEASDFFLEDHVEIYRALQAIHAAGRPIDAMILRNELQKRGTLAECGDVEYLGEILNSVPSAANGPEYAKVVREKSDARRAIRDCEEATRLLYGGEESHATISRLVSALTLVDSGRRRFDLVKLEDCLHQVHEELESNDPGGLESNFDEIRWKVGAFKRGEMTVIGGRPSMGKSTIAKDEIRRWAINGVPCGIVPLEETRKMIARKYIASHGSIDASVLRSGNPKALKEHWTAINGAIGKLSTLPIYIADGAYDVKECVAAADQLVSQHKCQAIVWDHMHLMDTRAADGMVDKLSHISKTLKHTIRRLDIVGIVVVQLNRANTQRDDKRPTLSDIRGCGSIEQDADTVMFVHRDDYYNKNGNKNGEADIIIAKARDGEVGDVKLRFNGKHQRFENIVADPFGVQDEAF